MVRPRPLWYKYLYIIIYYTTLPYSAEVPQWFGPGHHYPCTRPRNFSRFLAPCLPTPFLFFLFLVSVGCFRLCLVLQPRPLWPTQAAPWLGVGSFQHLLSFRLCLLCFFLVFSLFCEGLRIFLLSLFLFVQFLSFFFLLSLVMGLRFLCSPSRPPSSFQDFFFGSFLLCFVKDLGSLGECSRRKSTKLNETKRYTLATH